MSRIKFQLETNNPVAQDSFDYLYPLGATHDNYKNQAFNTKMYAFPGAVLDLGCAGGGFVKNCLDDGRDAVGLEGTDFNFKGKLREWKTIPHNLFTCDITKPFTVYTENKTEPYKFGIITAWEVLEHIERTDLPQLLTNIHKHLREDGIIIVSVNVLTSFSPVYPTVDLHRTKKRKDWWRKTFLINGFKEDLEIEKYFGDDWVRHELGTYHLVFRNL